ncbi:alpha/beta-hydrolase [Aureobasidium subglaciale]|nr:alpha/beta-hydrolase [Aureobasidium subglaciale]
MAAPNGGFFIQDKLYKKAPHHESFKQLWETKWKKPCSMGIYPFMFSAIQDFEPIVEKLVESDFKEPYSWDDYAQVYFPKAEELVSEAQRAEQEGNKEKASEFYLLREYPVHEIEVPHTHGIEGEGRVIPIYHLLPSDASESNPAAVVLIMTGLDGYRTELAVWMEGWRQNGIGSIVVEIPGTGDSPALASDPTSPDRQWSSLLDWIDTQPAIAKGKVCVWAFSTGGYYAIRLAHTHPTRLAGVVALGGGVHHMFDEEWLNNVNNLEYPFDLATTLCYKYGYGDDFEKFKKEAKKFSLLEDGTLDKPECARLLLVNGTEDEIFPIDDYYLCLLHGAPKEARFVQGIKHMGEPESFFIILKWIYKLFGIKANPVDQMKTIPFKPKY